MKSLTLTMTVKSKGFLMPYFTDCITFIYKLNMRNYSTRFNLKFSSIFYNCFTEPALWWIQSTGNSESLSVRQKYLVWNTHTHIHTLVEQFSAGSSPIAMFLGGVRKPEN